jgi:hypothetical protein
MLRYKVSLVKVDSKRFWQRLWIWYLMLLSVYRFYVVGDRVTNEYSYGAMRIDSGNRSTRTKSAPVPPYSPQIPHHLSLLPMFYDTQEIYVFVLCLSLSIIKNTTFHVVIEVRPLQRTQQSRCLPPFHLSTQTDPVCETLFSSEHRIMDEVKKTVIPNANFVKLIFIITLLIIIHWALSV